jgi:hypothetical protein
MCGGGTRASWCLIEWFGVNGSQRRHWPRAVEDDSLYANDQASRSKASLVWDRLRNVLSGYAVQRPLKLLSTGVIWGTVAGLSVSSLAQSPVAPKTTASPAIQSPAKPAAPTSPITPTVAKSPMPDGVNSTTGDSLPSPSSTPGVESPKPSTSKPIIPSDDETPAEPEATTPVKSFAVYISDSENHRIIRLADMSGRGLLTLGTPGHGLGRLLSPEQIWVDSRARIYIADKGNNRIVRIDDITGRGWVEMVGLTAPEGVALNGKELIVSDTGKSRVLVYSEFGGKLLHTYEDPRMRRPGHLWIDEKGGLFVTCNQDSGGKIVNISEPADVSGVRWTFYEGNGLKGNGFSPSQVVTEKKRVWCADALGNRLVRCEDMQGHGPRILGSLGQQLGRFYAPRGLAIDPQGGLYVADSGNDRIVFVPNNESSSWQSFNGQSGEAEGLTLRAPASVFVWSPAPPMPPDEPAEGDEKGKKKKNK